MATNLMLLIKARNAIIDGKPTPLSRSIAFLYREYDVRAGQFRMHTHPISHCLCPSGFEIVVDALRDN